MSQPCFENPGPFPDVCTIKFTIHKTVKGFCFSCQDNYYLRREIIVLDHGPDLVSQADRKSELNWRKSSISAGHGECIEVASSDADVLVRDSRNKAGTVLRFTCGQWLRFLSGLKNVDDDRARPKPSLMPIWHLPAIP
jgi:hypothetical protein